MKKLAVAFFCLTLSSSLAFCATEEKKSEQEEETKVETVQEQAETKK